MNIMLSYYLLLLCAANSYDIRSPKRSYTRRKNLKTAGEFIKLILLFRATCYSKLLTWDTILASILCCCISGLNFITIRLKSYLRTSWKCRNLYNPRIVAIFVFYLKALNFRISDRVVQNKLVPGKCISEYCSTFIH